MTRHAQPDPRAVGRATWARVAAVVLAAIDAVVIWAVIVHGGELRRRRTGRPG